MTGMLASVNNPDEALMALKAGVDIIDLKQPSRGALGALELDLIIQIVELINHLLPVSATIGDLPTQSETVFQAVEKTAAAGVDFIKIGFFPGGNWTETINKLASLTCRGHQLIAVLFADTQPNINIIQLLADSGFTGVMLDTMDKGQGSLSTIMSFQKIEQFVNLAKSQNLLCGLAGSLRENDIAELLLLKPDYLGFRGALCHRRQRTAQLDIKAINQIKLALDKNSIHNSISRKPDLSELPTEILTP